MNTGSAQPLHILISGMIGAVPAQGGATWAVLQYLLGFARLGHEVSFVEEVGPQHLTPSDAPLYASRNAAYCASVMNAHGLGRHWALVLTGTRSTAGMDYREVVRRAEAADVVINLAGTLRETALLEPAARRVYVDLDPAFAQLWQSQGVDMGFTGHTHFLTVGQTIGTDACDVPTGGLPWLPTLPPVVLQGWPLSEPPTLAPITTVANWRSYGSIEHDGVYYGQKAHSLRRLLPLPAKTAERLLLALAIHPDEHSDIAALARHGWDIVDPATVTSTPDTYRAFIRGSKAELGVAKSGYVASRCGWFSDRSACYLASGRPVVAEDTGFGCALPTGAGLLTFSDVDEAAAAIDTVARDYGRHATAARRLAEQHLVSDKNLAALLVTIDAVP